MSVKITRGILNLPGATAAAKDAVERYLAKDVDEHHCFFHVNGFHNHLSHHVLAALDLGASTDLLEHIYVVEDKIQRPILLDNGEKVLKSGVVTEANWRDHLGDPK
jgi:hypothetical protein